MWMMKDTDSNIKFVTNYWFTEISVIFQKFIRYFGINRYFYRFFGKLTDISYQSNPRTGYKIYPFFLKKKKKNIRCYSIIWPWFAGKGWVFQPAQKIVELGFIKFKSNGTKAKTPLQHIQKPHGAKKKTFFLWFSMGVLHGLSPK